MDLESEAWTQAHTVQHHSVGWNLKFWNSLDRAKKRETNILIDFDSSVTVNIGIYLYLLLQMGIFSYLYLIV